MSRTSLKITNLFKYVSEQMTIDFKKSAEFNHHGNRGDFRETTLVSFLQNGKLPDNFCISSGEIISKYSQVSKQMDLVIYDKSKSIIFEASQSTKVFPIESVLGVIEVKSKLSKIKLFEGLENIKSLKVLHSPQVIHRDFGGVASITYKTERPFGVIFAYSLGGNSLDSLRENLREWCKENPPELWPNLICILNVGIIKFTNMLDDALISSQIKSSSTISAIHYKEDALFEFTSSLLTLCSTREIDIFNIKDYKIPGVIVDDLRVGFTNEMYRAGNNSQKVRPSNEFIKKLHCENIKPILYKELIYKISEGFNTPEHKIFEDRNDLVYVYDPENLPSISSILNADHSDKKMIEKLQGKHFFGHGINFNINEKMYYVPFYYLENNFIDF